MILGMKRKIELIEDGNKFPNFILNNLYFKINKFLLEDKNMVFKIDLITEDEVDLSTEIIRKQTPYERTFLDVSYINENKFDEDGKPIFPLEKSQKVIRFDVDILNNFINIELSTENLTMEEFNSYVEFVNSLSV